MMKNENSLSLLYLDLEPPTEQLDWIPGQPFQVSEEVKAWLYQKIVSLSVQSYAGNWLRYSKLCYVKETLPLDQAVENILQWMTDCMPYCEEVMRAPNFHAPYTHYQFRMQASIIDLSCSADVMAYIGQEDTPSGLGNLYCYRLKNERFVLHFSPQTDLRESADWLMEVHGKTIETLIAEGRVF